MQTSRRSTQRGIPARWQSVLRVAICVAASLGTWSSVWAQEAAAAADSEKGGFATVLAYLLTIIVIALGVAVICRTTSRDDQSNTLIRDSEERLPGEY